MENLRPKQFYADLHQQITAHRCRRIEKEYKDKISTCSDQRRVILYNFLLNIKMYSEKSSRALRKEETINRWMEDEKRQVSFLNGFQPSFAVYCSDCGQKMNVSSKEIYHRDENRVLVFFECPNRCKKLRVFFDNGDEDQTGGAREKASNQDKYFEDNLVFERVKRIIEEGR